ncbi:6407_t:CDS:1, partial [Ambispora gerdemannii]
LTLNQFRNGNNQTGGVHLQWRLCTFAKCGIAVACTPSQNFPHAPGKPSIIVSSVQLAI